MATRALLHISKKEQLEVGRSVRIPDEEVERLKHEFKEV